MARQFRFVAVSNPTQAPSPESRKQDYSHAFRQAHAQRRRKQTERYRKGILLASGPVIKVLPQAASEEAPFSSPLSQVTVLNNNKDPFSSMARPLSSVEYFLLHHYIHVIIPSTLGHCSLFSSSSSSDHPYPSPGTVESHKTQLLREWVGLAITDNDLMTAAVLLSTCRYIIQQVQPDKKPVFARLALQYKQTCLETLRQKVNNNTSAGGVVSVMTVAKAIALAVDEVTAGEHTIARKHVQGVVAMVDSSGGARGLGLTGLLERMYRRFLVAFSLA